MGPREIKDVPQLIPHSAFCALALPGSQLTLLEIPGSSDVLLEPAQTAVKSDNSLGWGRTATASLANGKADGGWKFRERLRVRKRGRERGQEGETLQTSQISSAGSWGRQDLPS